MDRHQRACRSAHGGVEPCMRIAQRIVAGLIERAVKITQWVVQLAHRLSPQRAQRNRGFSDPNGKFLKKHTEIKNNPESVRCGFMSAPRERCRANYRSQAEPGTHEGPRLRLE